MYATLNWFAPVLARDLSVARQGDCGWKPLGYLPQ